MLTAVNGGNGGARGIIELLRMVDFLSLYKNGSSLSDDNDGNCS